MNATGAEALERELENMKAERNRWRNLCNRLHNALRCANNGFTGDGYSQRVIDDADQAFMNAIKSETKEP